MIGSFLAITQEELDSLLESPEDISEFLNETHEEKVIDIDKTWHGIHFMLTGNQYGGDGPLANVIFGAQEIGDEDVGYGPALGTPASTVKGIAAAFCSISEAEFKEKFNPSALSKADIYPQIWDEGNEALEQYLLPYFRELQQFYKNAAENNLAVITFLN
jgi:hypothetical protein